MNWKPWETDADGCYPATEGETYLFAVQLASGRWEYFIDALVWDSETPPRWRDGEHGWPEDVATHFCELESPE